jgi:hypothetical protein
MHNAETEMQKLLTSYFWGYNIKKLTHFDVTNEHFVLPDTVTDRHT